MQIRHFLQGNIKKLTIKSQMILKGKQLMKKVLKTQEI